LHLIASSFYRHHLTDSRFIIHVPFLTVSKTNVRTRNNNKNKRVADVKEISDDRLDRRTPVTTNANHLHKFTEAYRVAQKVATTKLSKVVLNRIKVCQWD